MLAPADDFDTRWAAWVAHGRVHERRARRVFIAVASAIAIVAAAAFMLLR